MTPGKDRIERARLSLAHMGSSVSELQLSPSLSLCWSLDFECLTNLKVHSILFYRFLVALL